MAASPADGPPLLSQPGRGDRPRGRPARREAVEKGPDTALALVRSKIEEGNSRRLPNLLRRAESKFGVLDSEEAKHLKTRLEALLAAHRLMDDGRRFFAAHSYPEACEKFRQAGCTVPDDAGLTAGIVHELIQQGIALVDADWRRAQTVLDAACDVDAAHSEIPALRERIENRRREEAIASAEQEAGEAAQTLAGCRPRKKWFRRRFHLIPATPA